jgi:hypothetical protein
MLKTIKTIFWVKILKFFDADPGWKKFGSGMEKSRIRGKHPGSAALVSTWEIQNKKSDRMGRFTVNTKANVSWEN